MPNRQPKSRLISYPAEFKPLLDKELEAGGYYTYCELVGRIFAEHYGTNKKAPRTPAVIKGRKIE